LFLCDFFSIEHALKKFLLFSDVAADPDPEAATGLHLARHRTSPQRKEAAHPLQNRLIAVFGCAQNKATLLVKGTLYG
jgi:hypothetical protein